MTRTWLVILAICGGAVLGGCDFGVNTARPIDTGFLGRDVQYKKVGTVDFDRYYIRPDVNWHRYTKVRIVHIRSYVHPDPTSGYRGFTAEEVAQWLTYFRQQMIASFSTRYQITDLPGPDVLDIRVAVTAMSPTNVAASAATWAPGVSEAEAVYSAVEDKSLAQGRAGIELGFFDSQTGELLFGYLSMKIGGKLSTGQFSKWGDVENAFKNWSRKMVDQLEKFQIGQTEKAKL